MFNNEDIKMSDAFVMKTLKNGLKGYYFTQTSIKGSGKFCHR